jgi:hypothetical protein
MHEGKKPKRGGWLLLGNVDRRSMWGTVIGSFDNNCWTNGHAYVPMHALV